MRSSPTTSLRRCSGTSPRLAFRPSVLALEGRDLPSGLNLLASASGPGGPALIRVADAVTGQVRFDLQPLGAFAGGVRVAVGDLRGAGTPDLVVGAGPGGLPVVSVFDGATGALRFSFDAFDPAFRGGVTVAVGDLDGKGKGQIIVGAGAGGFPAVSVFDGATGTLHDSFLAFGSGFLGGVNVAAGDINGDGRTDIIAGAGAGALPLVNVFSGIDRSLIDSTLAFGVGFLGGVNVAAGDLSGDGRADLIAGAGAGGFPVVNVFSGATGSLSQSYLAFDPRFAGGVSVGCADVTGTGGMDVLAGAGIGGLPVLNAFRGSDGALLRNTFAFDSATPGGVNVCGLNTEPQDAALLWNRATLQTVTDLRLSPPVASRLLAMVSLAQYNAVNGILGGHAAYQSGLPAPGLNASPDVAAATAAYAVLVHEYPARAVLLNPLLQAAEDQQPDATARGNGYAYGQAVATALLVQRANDGAKRTVAYTPSGTPGTWVPTPPGYLPALLPNWAMLTPFAMTSATQFAPPAPPNVGSAAYAVDFNEVKAVGAANSTVRTAEQTQSALFWADDPGTVAPPGHWNKIAEEFIPHQAGGLEEHVRSFALMNVALADAAIVAWNAKFADNTVRPVTAIRNPSAFGNPALVADPTWTPLIVTPPFPSYISGHSTFSGAAATVLTALFGSVSFYNGSDALPNVSRFFPNFQAAADEAGQSRIYGGIHYQYDNVAGKAAGRALGAFVAGNFLK